MLSRSVTYHSIQPPIQFAFQVAAANLRFGDGVTAEVGMDLKNMKARKVRFPDE